MLYQLLSEGSSASPGLPLVVHPGGSVSYAELASRSEALLDGLRRTGEDRFGCLIDDVADLLAVLCAASATGAEPCVYPAHLTDESTAEFASRLEHRFVITDRDLDSPGIRSVSVQDLAGESGQEADPHTGPHPVLILTTGTTGQPKATRHDWARLVRSVKREGGTSTRWLLTYNPNQFAGIQIILHVLVNRATLVVPLSRRPGDVIDAIRHSGVTHVSGTPTFWRMLLTHLDGSSAAELQLRQITLGGEAVPGFLLDNLRDLFPEARISQVYAATEFGSTLSVSDGQPGLPASVLSRGDEAGARLRIVDGELQVQSEVGMLSYLNGQDVGREWIPTGDLVEVVGDRILFVGRTNDRINVGGAKVYPIQVEEIVGSVPGVAVAVAYGRPNPITGNVVALDVVLQAGFDQQSVDAAIRDSCQQLPAAARPRLIRFVDELVLAGGKAVRRPVDRG